MDINKSVPIISGLVLAVAALLLYGVDRKSVV